MDCGALAVPNAIHKNAPLDGSLWQAWRGNGLGVDSGLTVDALGVDLGWSWHALWMGLAWNADDAHILKWNS